MDLVRRTSSSAALLAVLCSLAACGDGNARRPIEMVPIPPPSAQPPDLPTPTDAPAASTTGNSSGTPQPLPTPVSGKPDSGADSDGPTPLTTTEDDLKSALSSKGWSIAGKVQTAKKGAYEVVTAEIRKGAVKGRVRLVRPKAGGDPGEARPPYLPAGANEGVIVDAEGPRGADSYFYDKDVHLAGLVDLRVPGTRQESSDLLRACFPFVH